MACSRWPSRSAWSKAGAQIRNLKWREYSTDGAPVQAGPGGARLGRAWVAPGDALGRRLGSAWYALGTPIGHSTETGGAKGQLCDRRGDGTGSRRRTRPLETYH